MKSFRLEHVKSFKDSGEIELKPLTIFVGPNSSGKSSLMRFPVVLGQTFRDDVNTPLLLNGFQVDYGDFDDVIFGHKGDSFGFSLKFDRERLLKNSLVQIPTDFKEAKCSIEVFKEDFLKIKKINLSLDDDTVFDLTNNRDHTYTLNLKIFAQEFTKKIILEQVEFNKFIPKLNHSEFYNSLLDSLQITSPQHKKVIGKMLHLILQTDMANFVDQITNLYNVDFLNEMASMKAALNKEDLKSFTIAWDLTQTYAVCNSLLSAIYTYYIEFLKNLTYIGPFRSNPDRDYRYSENKIINVGRNGENAIALLAQDTRNKHGLITKVSKWFNQTMSCDIQIAPINNSLYKVLVYNNQSGNKNGENLIDVGFGIAQILPIVTQLYHDQDNSGRDKTYIIEQPELHLHPAAQSSLAELFVEKVSNEPNSRILIETHSEHLLRKLQVLVSDPDVSITKEEVAIYYVAKTEDGSSSVQKMELNAKGQFTDIWPSGFFDKSYELSKELIRASTKPQKS